MNQVWNLEEYVDLVVDATVGEGVARQMEAFKGGFQQVFPLMAIRLFGEEELERLICGCVTLTNPLILLASRCMA
jgi:E3 ubiquitin-protein ligase TRIP12